MAIWNSKDFLSTKYTTAVIFDKGNRAYSVEIKNTIDDYFTVTISRQRYVFRLDGQRIMTWRHLGRKTCRFLLYTIDHYLPMSPQDNKELETILRENSLPKVDGQLLDLFKYLGKREKSSSNTDKEKMFKEHDLDKIVELVAANESEFPETAQNLKTFFERLQIKQIITPVKHISEMLESELKTTDAKIFGDLEEQVKRTEKERKAMSNTVKDAKKNWLVIGLLGLLIGGGAIFGIWAYESGAFNNLGSGLIPSTSNTPTTLQGIMQKYPTPESLKAAIDRGDVKLSDLPPEAKSMLSNYKPPIATPAK